MPHGLLGTVAPPTPRRELMILSGLSVSSCTPLAWRRQRTWAGLGERGVGSDGRARTAGDGLSELPGWTRGFTPDEIGPAHHLEIF